MIEYLSEILRDNQFAQGGLVISIVAGIIAYIRYVPSYIFKLVRRYGSCTVTYQWGSPKFGAAMAIVKEWHANSFSGPFIDIPHRDRSIRIPGGPRYKWWGRALIRTQVSSRDLPQGDSKDAVTYSISVTIYAISKKKALSQFESWVSKKAKVANRKLMCRVRDYAYWKSICPLPKRSWENTAYRQELEILPTVLNQFQTSRDWYFSRGIPYRLGLMFSGPAGTGKSTLAIVIARYLGRDLKIIRLGSMTSESLREVFAGDNSIFLIEDIDASDVPVGDRSDVIGPPKVSTVTLSDILNSIDGVCSGSGNILIINTNYPEKLDSALLRPGRIDYHFCLGFVDNYQYQKLCQLYYGKPGDLKISDTHKLTPADLQIQFIQHPGSIEDFENAVWTKISQN